MRNKITKLNKKGSVLDGAFVMLFFLVIVIYAIIFLTVIDSYNTAFQASGASSQAKTLQQNLTTDLRNRADGAMILYFVILMVGTWATSFFLDSHPLYFIVFAAASFLTYYIVIPFVNVLYYLQIGTSFTAEIAVLPKTFFVIDHYGAFLALYTITNALVLYAKFKYVGRGNFG